MTRNASSVSGIWAGRIQRLGLPTRESLHGSTSSQRGSLRTPSTSVPGSSAAAALPLLTQPQKSHSITLLHPVGYKLLKPIHIQGGGHSPPPASHVSPLSGASVEDIQVFSKPPYALHSLWSSLAPSLTHMCTKLNLSLIKVLDLITNVC